MYQINDQDRSSISLRRVENLQIHPLSGSSIPYNVLCENFLLSVLRALFVKYCENFLSNKIRFFEDLEVILKMPKWKFLKELI